MEEESNQKDEHKKYALDYHSQGRPGKIEVRPSKPCITQRDLSLAYTPGVAAPCLEIAKNPDDVYKYTSKGNLVGVISNGTAVLGLGDIGPAAGKPVMEGKGVLFKRFADIDVFDIEVDENTVEGMVKIVKSLGPTFGGINLEDIKAPECFEIEKQLIELMDIPVFHDDQHGTAIIASAAFLNALEISKRDISKVKVVFSGAGAAAIACAKLFFVLGVKKENLILCDSKGAVYLGRKEGMNKYKEEFAIKTDARTLADALKGADAFVGCSARGVVTKDMVKTMAATPIIFAMANPEPEIYPHEVFEVRTDAIMATGRSDFPNQVNNVLGFPFIFRGALDVRARKINIEMKLAAVKALASLAKEEVPDEVKAAYSGEDFNFGPNYLIPKPFDKRVLTRVSPAVAKAAMDSGVARIKINDLVEYAAHLSDRMGNAAGFTKAIRDSIATHVAKTKTKITMAFAAGSNSRILNAVNAIIQDDKIEPILIGKKVSIHKKMDKLRLEHLKDLRIVDPEKCEFFDEFCEKFYQEKKRDGISRAHAEELMKQANYFGPMLAREGKVDSFLAGPNQSYPECFVPMMKVLGPEKGKKSAGVYVLNFKSRIIFFSDCTAQITPTSDDLAHIAIETTKLYRALMKKEPRVAFLSFSNFGSSSHECAKKVKRAVEITKKLDAKMIVEGELQADVALSKSLQDMLFDFCELQGPADILIFPDLSSANISYKLLSQLSDASAIGPIIVPMNKAANIIQRTANLDEIINMASTTAFLSTLKK